MEQTTDIAVIDKKVDTKTEIYTVLSGVDLVEFDLWDVFCFGVDYGQLLMEEERENEGWFDAFLGKVYDAKFSMPMAQTQTRQVHSEKWFEAKKKGFNSFKKLMYQLKGRSIFKVAHNYCQHLYKEHMFFISIIA